MTQMQSHQAHNEKMLREKLLKHWHSLSKEELKRDRKDLMKATAEEFKMPEEVIEKVIGDWSSGQKG